MRSIGPTATKFAVFGVVMVLLTSALFVIFSGYRAGSTNTYSAVFHDVSQLRAGDSVRQAGIPVGTVESVRMQPDRTVLVDFDADRDIVLTTGVRLAVRYLNLTGDRYLDLLTAPGMTSVLSPGSQIPPDRTDPALDLDVLIGGLKPVIQGLNPADVNALTSSLLQVFQGEGPTVTSLFTQTSSFSNAMADNGVLIQQLIDNLNTVLGTLANDGTQFSSAIDRLQHLVSGLAQDRDPIASAIGSLDAGTASIADLLSNARQPLHNVVDQLSRLAPLLDADKDRLDGQLQRLPQDYRKLSRVASYGGFVNYYLCGIAVRVTDLQGRTASFPWVRQEGGRCAEPNG
jgi:phospholipid/cholesterol/gamma-HCH transport system substrate-binding protein